jgi:peptidyl-prolyl cis-trans isomerase D
MSVIQNIQEKYAKLMAIIIAVALMIFVVMLAFENGGRLFSGGGNSTSVGTVNGETIVYTDFLKKVDQQEKNMEAQYAQYGGGVPPGLRQQALDEAWTQEVNQVLQNNEFDKLGLKVGKKEMGDILYGSAAPDELKKAFTDSTTGIFNSLAAKQYIDQKLKLKKGTAEQLEERERMILGINSLQTARLTDKYNSIFANSVNVPKWFIEKENADKSQLAKISLVRDMYGANSDSTIKISDKEIEDYVNKHKKDFKQPESRSIDYVTFSALPSASDSDVVRNKVLGLKPEFDTTHDVNKVLIAQGITTFYDSYLNGPRIQIPVKDSIFKLPIGAVYGPYIDGSNYTLAKLLGVRHQPDTVKVRHILVATSQRDPQSGQMYPVKDSATARKTIDSIQTAIRNGANFDSLCAKLSDDGTKNTGGIYDNVEPGRMVAEFNDFIFGNPVGSKGVVKTDFGFHYIEILSQKGNTAAYKIAYISKPIEVSQETETNALSEASLFAGDSRDQKSFDANVEKLKAKGVNKIVAAGITPMASDIQGLGPSRPFIKNIYKAKKGDVLDPERVGDSYVVAIVTEINEEGTLPVAKARPLAEPLLKNKKVAEKLKQKIGTITTLEAAATALGGKPIETADSLRMTGARPPILTRESKIIGAAFNPANRGKVVTEAIEGADGIYVIRVDNVTATPVPDANVAEQRKARYQQGKQQAMYQPTLKGLRDAAKIKDRRSDFF